MRTEKIMTNPNSELLTRRQLTALFQVSLPTLLRWQDAGKLLPVRLGAGTVRYRRADIESLITDAASAASQKEKHQDGKAH
jgi:predicted DNA-binding transcriptional regulator AlpA